MDCENGHEAAFTGYRDKTYLHDLARKLEFMLGDRKDEWLAARLEDLLQHRHRSAAQAVRTRTA